jgi:hypothetical protein
MFDFEVQGLDSLIGKFDRLTRQIELAKEEMPREFVTWQRDDMKRRYPNMQTGQGGDTTTAITSIWPRSRAYDEKLRVRPKRAGPRRYSPRRIVHSTRPVLRRELYLKLVQRMTELVGKAMKWP